MQKVLLKVSGVDAPGISARIMKCIQQIEGTLEDIEQVVTQGLLSLMILTKVDSKKIPDFEKNLKTELSTFSDLEIKIQTLSDQETPIADPTNRFVITVIAKSIPVDFLSPLTESIAAKKYNIDSLRKLTSSGLSTIELICSSKEKINIPQISEALVAISSKFPGVDIAIQKENLYRRSKRLIVFDMDSTLVQGEVIDELAALVGKKDEVSALTKRAMEGEIDFQESLLKRVSLLRGLTKKT